MAVDGTTNEQDKSADSPRETFVAISEKIYAGFLFFAPSDRLYKLVECHTRKKRSASLAEDIYVLAVTLLLVLLWLFVDPGDSLATVALVIAIVRGAEVMVVALGLILVRDDVHLGRDQLLVAAVYGVQLPLILAIIARIGMAGEFSAAGGTHPSSPLEFLYICWTNMTTLGNNYVATTDLARGLVIASGAVGIILLGLFITVGVGRLADNGGA
jgi:hypothetical protein